MICLSKNNFPLKLFNMSYLQECITSELSIKNKIYIFHNEFTNFINFSSLVLVDFNAKKVWFDQDNTTTEGTVINDIMAEHGLTQIIQESTHLLDCSSSCIDLIFTSQNNLITNSGVHSSLHSNCHHQIIVHLMNVLSGKLIKLITNW